MAQWLTNPTRDHEVAGSVPALAQWVNDPVVETRENNPPPKKKRQKTKKKKKKPKKKKKKKKPIYQNLWMPLKQCSEGKLIAISVHIKKKIDL